MDNADTQLQMIHVDQLTPSPTNPRRSMSEEGLNALVQSIVQHGGLTHPPLVRPRTGGGWEIVCGHRRVKAAGMAGLQFVPCLVQAMSDEEAAKQQLLELAHSEPVSPIEEAETYRYLQKERKLTVKQIAQELRVSVPHVWRRLELLKLHADVKQAVAEKKIGVGVAELLVEVVNPELQVEALGAILREGMSEARARKLVEGCYRLQLDQAPFDVDDATLVKGAKPCGRCPKNSAKQLDLLGAGPARCLDVACWKAKVAADAERKREVEAPASEPEPAGQALAAAPERRETSEPPPASATEPEDDSELAADRERAELVNATVARALPQVLDLLAQADRNNDVIRWAAARLALTSDVGSKVLERHGNTREHLTKGWDFMVGEVARRLLVEVLLEEALESAGAGEYPEGFADACEVAGVSLKAEEKAAKKALKKALKNGVEKPKPTCLVPECQKPQWTGTLCEGHAAWADSLGYPYYDLTEAQLRKLALGSAEPEKAPPTETLGHAACPVPGCGRKEFAKGLCAVHRKVARKLKLEGDGYTTAELAQLAGGEVSRHA